MNLLNINCRCGHNENYTSDQCDRLDWNENETVDCPCCGSQVKSNGWNKPKAGTAVWVKSEQK